jgi:hypothetical protein
MHRMIAIRELPGGDLEVGQWLNKPSVYLDHWAFIQFADFLCEGDALNRP